MAMCKLLWLAVACLLLALQIAYGQVASTDTRAEELVYMLSKSKTKVLDLDQDQWKQYALGSPRPYALAVFLDAEQMKANPQTQLDALLKEYSYAARSFAAGPDAERIFFVRLVYERNQEVFAAMQVSALPLSFVWRGDARPKSSGRYDVKEADKLLRSNFRRYPWPAEDVRSFFMSKTDLRAADIDRPTLLKNPLFPPLALVGLGAAAYVGWKLFNTPLVQNRPIWLAGSLVVYWFSTSGGMFNIIRGMPMYQRGQDGKLHFFMSGRQGQYGAEGFIMGSTYLLFSLALAVLVYVSPRVQSKQARTLTSFGAIMAVVWLGFQIFGLYKSKNGYWLRLYL